MGYSNRFKTSEFTSWVWTGLFDFSCIFTSLSGSRFVDSSLVHALQKKGGFWEAILTQSVNFI